MTLSGPALLGGSRTGTTGQDGDFRFLVLPPGTYAIRVEASGFTPAIRSDVLLTLGATATVNVVLNIASVREAVNVSVNGPVIDVASAAMPTNIDERMLQNLPVRRNVSELLALAPGIFNPTPVPGLVVAYGGTIGSNGLYLDGVDMTEPRRQGLWLPINYNWIDQVQVAALGAGAEYGGFTGAAAHAVLRSGSNRFSGLAEYWTTRWSWVDRNGSSLAGRELLTWWDITTQSGGPIRQDQLWYFAGVEMHRRKDRPRGYSGDAARSETTPRVVLKLTQRLSQSARLEGHLQHNRSTIEAANAGPFTAEDALNELTQSDTSWNVRLTRPLGKRTLWEIRAGGYASRWRDDPIGPGSRSGPAPRTDGNITRANSASYQDHWPTRFDIASTIARSTDDWLGGRHDFELGFEYEENRSVKTFGFPGGRRINVAGDRVLSILEFPGERTEAEGRHTVLYAQDRWSVSDRVTLNAGVRADFNRGAVPQGGTVLSTSPISPRIGVAWALDGSNQSALKLHFGRYYDALLTERVAFMDIPGLSQTIGYLVGEDGALTEAFRSAPPAARAIDPDIRQSYVDQYLVGYERQFWQDATIQASYVHRRFDDFMAMTDTGSVWAPIEIQDPGQDGRFGTGDDGPFFSAFRPTNPGAQFLYFTNPPDAFRRYHAVQVVISKRWARNWQLQASYTLAKTTATVGNSDFANAGLNDTGEITGSRVPSVLMNPNGSINAEGHLPFAKNEFKVVGLYSLPVFDGINFSGILWRQSGARWERMVNYFNTVIPGNFQTIRVEPRGSRETDPIWNLDLRIEPTLGRLHGAFGMAFEVLNATNQGTPMQLLEVSGGSFGAPLTRSDPRTLRVLIRYRWRAK